jgi:hypothetical protein
MATLTVPAPTLKYPAAPGIAALESLLEINCGAVTFADGSPFVQSQQKSAGFLVYRQLATIIEIWDEAAQQWEPDPRDNLLDLKLKAFAFKADRPDPWQGLIVPAGEKDAQKNPLFQATSITTNYAYFFRAVFVSNDKTGGIAGWSTPSASVQFSSLIDTIRAGINIKPQEIQDATEIELFLKDPGLKVIGSVKIISSGGTTEIEIANRDNLNNVQASIRLLANGDIVLRPIGTGKVRIEGQLETENILYLPTAAPPVGPKKFLV